MKKFNNSQLSTDSRKLQTLALNYLARRARKQIIRMVILLLLQIVIIVIIIINVPHGV